MKIFSQKRLFAYLLAVCIILSSMWGVVFAQTNVFEQNFNDNLDGVTPASFKTVERPAEGVTEYTPYTPAPNDGKDGALLSNMENGSKVKIDFGGAKTGKIIFEGQFRLEGQEAKSSAIKFFDIYDDKNKCILMFTIGNSDANGFDVRPVHRSADGAAQTAPYPINGGRIPYKTWHTLRVEIDTEAGTMDVYVNGYQLVSGGYPWGYTAAGTKIPNIAYSTSYHSAADHTIPFLIDNVRIYRDAPLVRSVAVKGAAMAGGTLTADADIYYPGGYTAGAPIYTWEASANGADGWQMVGTNAVSYTIPASDIGSYLRVGVTPTKQDGTPDGDTVYSDTVGPVQEFAAPPSINGDVTIVGEPEVGNELTPGYTYQPSSSGKAEGESQFLWERADAADGDFITVASTKNYTPVYADKDKYIRLTVTPVDTSGLAGTPQISAPVLVTSDADGFVFYVAPDGDDVNPGTQSKPFATIEKAKTAVQGLANQAPVTVLFKAGEYDLTETVSFTAADSGTPENPVVYQAYGDGEVRFVGGKTLDTSLAVPVTDQAVLNRVIDPYAKTRLVQIDLHAQGITNIPTLPDGYGYAQKGWQPMEVYFNGKALTLARWPNDSFLNINFAEGQNPNFTLGYDDPEDRAKLWDKSKVENDLFIWGNIGYTWAGVSNRIKTIDPQNKRITSASGTQYPPTVGRKFYFFNLIEELDQPGECYIDRENGILYFYPPSDLEGAELAVSMLDTSMLNLSGASHITFDGLTFTETRGNIVEATGVDKITIQNCELSHTSSNAVTLSGKNCTIENCHIYDLGGNNGTGGLHISGGDRKTLTPSGHVIRNNRIHYGDRVYPVGGASLIRATGVGHVIENNELYDATAYLVQFVEANDIQFNYNEVHDAVRLSSDAGAVTWGRDPTMLGIEIKYNYFHDVGNTYGGYGQQSIFTDDGAAGGFIYGNIFYRGTLTTDQGGTPSNSFPIKTNGGQFMRVENNIFVDSPSATRFQPWNQGSDRALQDRWWLWVQDKYSKANSSIWSKMQKVEFDSEIWKQHYKDTQWKWLNELFSTSYYEQNLKGLDAKNDVEALTAIAKDKSPSLSGVFKNNVAVKLDQTLAQDANNCVESNTYTSKDGKLSSGASIFTEYGKNFKLTNDGLAEVKTKAPDFENIPTERIGLQPVEADGETRYVGGRAPSVSGLRLSGGAMANAAAKAAYTFTDPDGDREGFSDITWYVSDSANGTFSKIPGKAGKELYLDESYLGKYIRYEITPMDERMLTGEAAQSAAFQVTEPLSLDQLISEAEEMHSSVQGGEALGQVAQEKRTALQSAIDAAKSAVTETEKETAGEALRTAMAALRAAIVKEVSLPAGATAAVNRFMDSAKIDIPQNGYVTLPKGCALADVTVSGVLTVDGVPRKTVFTIPAGTVVTGSGEASLSFYTTNAAPSVAINNAKDITAVVLTNENIRFSKEVTLTIEGVSEKRISAINAGKLVAVGSNTSPVKKSNSGEAVVLSATALQELVLYDRDGSSEPTPTVYPTYQPSNQNGSGPTYSSGAGNPAGFGIPTQGNTNSASGNDGNGLRFADIAGHWAQADIEDMAGRGIVSGVTENTFEPERSVTRAEFATLVSRALKLSGNVSGGETEKIMFEDVPDDEWYYPYVSFAASAGFITGYNGQFRPNDLITREEMAVIVAKAYASLGRRSLGGGIERFADKTEISEWAYEPVDTVAAAGLISGVTADTFAPRENTTRAQAVAVLKRLLDQNS